MKLWEYMHEKYACIQRSRFLQLEYWTFDVLVFLTINLAVQKYLRMYHRLLQDTRSVMNI